MLGELPTTLNLLEPRKSPALDFIFLEFYSDTLQQMSSKILVLQFLHFLNAPTQNSQDAEKSINSCDL